MPAPFLVAGSGLSHKHLAGTARAEADGSFRLTDGTPWRAGSVAHAVGFPVTSDYTITADVRFGASGGSRLDGYYVGLANMAGYAPVLLKSENAYDYARLNSQGDRQVGVAAWVDGAGVSRVRYTEGAFDPDATELANDGGAMAPDLTSGDTFRIHQARVGTTLTLTVTNLTTAQVWTRVYSGRPALSLRFVIEGNETVARGYPMVVAVNSTGGNVIDVMPNSFVGTSAGVTATVAATGTLAVPGTGTRRITASVVSSAGALLRTLCQYMPVAGGGTYTFGTDGKDIRGDSFPAGYRFRLLIDEVSNVGALVGNNTGDPADGDTLLTGIAVVGLGVSRDGLSVGLNGYGGDTGNSAGTYLIDPTTGAIDPAASGLLRGAGQMATCCAVEDGDTGYLYVVATDDAGVDGTLRYWLTRVKKPGWPTDALYRTAFTGADGTVNADGSTLADWTFGGSSIRSLLLESIASPGALDPLDRYERITGIAVSATHVVVAYRSGGEVSAYHKATGLQSVAAIAVPYPNAVTVLGNGHYAISHGSGPGVRANTVVSVHSSADHSAIRTMTELTGLGNVVALSYATPGLLVADDGEGLKRARLHAISGSTATALPARTIGGPATFGDDGAGKTKFWHVKSAAIDDAGNVYVLHHAPTFRSLHPGGIVTKFDPADAFAMTRYALGYTNGAVAGSPSDPLKVYSTNLRKYALDPDAGSSAYLGCFAEPGDEDGTLGYAENPITHPGTGQARHPARWAAVGGREFLGLSIRYDRLVIRRLEPSGRLVNSSALIRWDETGQRRGTWRDAAGTGYPAPSDVAYTGATEGTLAANGLQLGPDGTAYVTDPNSGAVHAIPCQGLDADDNMLHDWGDIAEHASPGATGYDHTNVCAFVPSPQGGYLLVDDYTLTPRPFQGGASALLALSPDGRSVRWTMPLPEGSQAVDAADGWVLVGGFTSNRFWVVRSDGQLVVEVPPSSVEDFLDFQYGALTLSKLPDGRLVVLSESIYRSGQVVAIVDPRQGPAAFAAVASPGGTASLAAESTVTTYRLRVGAGGQLTISLRTTTA